MRKLTPTIKLREKSYQYLSGRSPNDISITKISLWNVDIKVNKSKLQISLKN